MRAGAAAPVTISDAVRADIPALVTMVAGLSRQEGDPDTLFTAARAEADLFGPGARLRALIARAAGDPAGSLLWHFAYETPYASPGAYVASLWVEPGHRRRGIATALIAALADHVVQTGGSHIWWASRTGNQIAHATYESLGARSEGVVAHALYGEAFEALAANYRTIGRSSAK